MNADSDRDELPQPAVGTDVPRRHTIAGHGDLTTAAADGGFAGPSHLGDIFHATFGLRPSALLATGVTIHLLDDAARPAEHRQNATSPLRPASCRRFVNGLSTAGAIVSRTQVVGELTMTSTPAPRDLLVRGEEPA